MAEHLALAAWGRAAGGSAILRVYESDAGQRRSSFTLQDGSAVPFDPVSDWRRIAFYERGADESQPNLVLDLVARADAANRITLRDPGSTSPIKVTAWIRWLFVDAGVDPADEIDTSLEVALELGILQGGRRKLFGSDGTVHFSGFEFSNTFRFTPGSIAEIAERRDVQNDWQWSDVRGARFPLIAELVGLDRSSLTARSIKDDLEGPLQSEHRWARDLTDAARRLSFDLVSSRWARLVRVEIDGRSRFLLRFGQLISIVKPAALPPFAIAIGPVGIYQRSLHRLHQRQSVRVFDDDCVRRGAPAPWVAEIDAVPGESVRRWLNDQVGTGYLATLRQTEGARAVSFMPRFEGGEPWSRPEVEKGICRAGGWWLAFDIEERLPRRAVVTRSELLSDGPIRARPRALYPMRRALWLETTLAFAGCRSHDGSALRWTHARVGSVSASVWDERASPLLETTPEERDRAEGVELRMQLSTSPRLAQSVALGALDLEFAAGARQVGDFDPGKAALLLNVGWLEDGEIRFRPGDPPLAFIAHPKLVPAIALGGRLPLHGMSPAGQDPTPAELSDAEASNEIVDLPIIVRRTPPTAETEYYLLVAEAAPSGRGHAQDGVPERPGGRLAEAGRRLRLQLQNTRRPGAPAETILVIDPTPFMVAQVDTRPQSGDGAPDEATNVVAEALRTPDQRLSWRMPRVERLVLTLPPQAVGEAMEKRRQSPNDIAPGETADFRLGPPATVTIDTSDRDTWWGDVPWNLRRLLADDANGGATGSPLQRLDAELFYGMSFSLDAARAARADVDGPVRDLFVAELGALIGGLATTMRPRQETTQQEQALRRAWSRIRLRWRRRLGVMQPYRLGSTNPPRFTDEVKFELRRKADLRYPVAIDDNQRTERNAPYQPDGLAGGFGWAFESSNIYEAVWRPTEDGRTTGPGEVNSLFLSALGGWAKQKALFDEDRTTIHADVAMGRAHRIVLERKGRIGVYWHPAKHVIIYERTVLPTRQFQDGQDPHLGRPILRKVREYVEILSPARRYPESGASPKAAGFVLGAEFRSTVMAVDSAWGRDLGSVGWEVPLWMPDADPIVYPRPQVLLRLATDPRSGLDSQLVEIAEPQKLVFFTSTERGLGADTDRWPAYLGVDFTDLPVPQPPRSAAPFHPTDPDRQLPDAPAQEAGYGRFTLAVVPPADKINLAAARGEEAMGVVLRNVTMVRARPRAGGPSASTTAAGKLSAAVANVSRDVESKLDALRALVERKIAGTGGPITEEELEEFRGFLRRSLIGPVRDAGSALSANPCAAAKEIQRRAVRASMDRARAALDRARDDVLAQVALVAGDLDALRAVAGGTLARMRDGLDAPSLLSSKLREQAAGAKERIEALSRAAQSAVLELRSRLGTAIDARQVELALDLLTRGLQGVAATIAEISSAGARLVRPALPDLADEIDDVATTLRGVIDEYAREIAQRIRAARPDAQDLLQLLAEQIDQVLAVLAATATDAIDGIVRGGSDLTDRWQELVGPGGALLDGIESTLAGATDGAETAMRDAVKRAFDDDGRRLLEAAEAQLAAAGDAAVEAICSALGGGLQGALDQLDARTEAALKALEQAARDAMNQTDRAREILERAWRDAEQELRSAIGGTLDRVADVATDALRDLATTGGEVLNQAGDGVLRLLRAFGDGPEVPGLALNRARLAYYFDELLDHVSLTPATALLDRASDALKALGLRLPIDRLAGQLLPMDLPKLDFSRILPDFAGLKLDRLLPSLQLDRLQPERMKVKHGIDQQTRRAWIEAEIDLPFEGTRTLFAFGPVRVALGRPHFRATTRTESGLDLQPQSRARGQILADWQLIVGGFKVIEFVDTPLTFDSARGTRLEIRPQNVRMDRALQFLSDAMSSMGPAIDGASGLKIELIKENGLPVGAASRLSLPLPDIAAGAFAITNLHFAASFEVLAVPEFMLAVSASLGRKTAPFNLTVFVLGGGGWVEARAVYRPFGRGGAGEIETVVSIGITASAGLALNFGVIRGSVMIYLGIYADLYASSSGARSLTVGLMLLIVGQASLAGIVTVGVRLLLEATYSEGGRLVGRGTLSYSIKIGWFFTLRVSQSVQYVFAKGSGTTRTNVSRQDRQRRLSEFE